MKAKTYLMSFEQLIQFLENNTMNTVKLPAINLPPFYQQLMERNQSAVLTCDLFEKFDRTWWEVELSDEGKILSQCFYVADSLQDALRLRPDIDTSYWCSIEENASEFLAEIAAWQEDDYF